MITRIQLRWLLAPALFLSFQLCQAQAPSGTFTFASDPSTPIWDVSGSYGLMLAVVDRTGNTTDVSLGVDLTQDSRGKITGSGLTDLGIGQNHVAGFYRVTGRVSRAGGATQVMLSIQIRNQGTIAGQPSIRFHVAVKAKLQVDPTTRRLVGQSRVSVALFGLGQFSGIADVLAPLPGAMDGSWTLTADILPLGNHLTGSATIVLSNGRPLSFTAVGRSPAPGAADLRLKALGGTKPSKLNFSFSGDSLTRLNGRIFSQKLLW